MKWKILDRTYKLRTKWLSVRQDKVEMPTGVVIDDYYVLEYPTWVNVIAITTTGKFVIERQYRHGTQSIDYELCAGTAEQGEAPLNAAKRELLEETGYGEGEWQLYNISAPNPSAMTNLNYTFIARGVRKISSSQQEETENIFVDERSQEEVFELLSKGKILQGQMQAPLWKYFYEIK